MRCARRGTRNDAISSNGGLAREPTRPDNIPMFRNLLVAGAALGFAGVALGAFGAHALAPALALRPGAVQAWETAVLYHLVHALAAMIAAGVAAHTRGAARRWAGRAGILFLSGAVLFSGSLYLLALQVVPRWVGPVTPLGGVLLLAGWLVLGAAAVAHPASDQANADRASA